MTTGAGTPPRALLVDLLMAVMDSIETWSTAAGDTEMGLAWRDAVTKRMVDAGRYRPYEDLVRETAAELGLASDAPFRLESAWQVMRPWPDVTAVGRLPVPYAFATNCSARLARVAAERSGLRPALVLSAEEAGFYKPRHEVYLLACERLGTAPGETRFVAGAAYDAAGAAAAGLTTWLVERRPLRKLPAGRIRVVQSLGEALAGMS